jgi:hypothetical protein
MSTGSYHSRLRNTLKVVVTLVVGMAFFVMQFSSKYYALSSRPVFPASPAAVSTSGDYFHHHPSAVLSLDKRFSVKKVFDLEVAFPEAPSTAASPKMPIIFPRDVIEHAGIIFNEKLRGPPAA